MQLKGRADMTSVTRLQECKPVKVGAFPTPQPLQSAGTQAGRRCDTCQGSWSCACLLAAVKEGPREYVRAERQAGVYRWGWGSSCCWISLGASFTYSTAPLLTSCPHTESHQQAHLFPCLRCWNLFLPSGLLETHWKQQLRRSPLPQACPPFSTSFHQLFFSPHLPLALRLRALPSSYTSIHIFSTFPHPDYTHGGGWLLVLPSHICLHIAPSHKLLLLPQSSPLVQTSPQNSYFPEESEHKLRDRQVVVICIYLIRAKEKWLVVHKSTKCIWYPILKACSLHFWKLKYIW